MIFGKTHEQRWDDMEVRQLSHAKGIKLFAWYPITLKDGRRVWLRYYWSYLGAIRIHVDGNTGKTRERFEAEYGIPFPFPVNARNYIDNNPEHISWK